MKNRWIREFALPMCIIYFSVFVPSRIPNTLDGVVVKFACATLLGSVLFYFMKK